MCMPAVIRYPNETQVGAIERVEPSLVQPPLHDSRILHNAGENPARGEARFSKRDGSGSGAQGQPALSGVFCVTSKFGSSFVLMST
jgi:hypothetical protein